MSRFTRVYVLLLSLVVMFSLITGCGLKGKDDITAMTEKDDSGAANTAEEVVEKEIPVINNGEPLLLMVELNQLNPTIDEVPTAEQPDVRNATRELAREFTELHPNVEVKFVYKAGSSWGEWMTTLMASRDLPDICHLHEKQ